MFVHNLIIIKTIYILKNFKELKTIQVGEMRVSASYGYTVSQ